VAKSNLKKQSQFAKGHVNVSFLLGKDCGDKPRFGVAKTNPIQSQSPGFSGNPKHETRSPKTDRILFALFENTKPISEMPK
jgi:hypothetical protein